MIKEFLNRTKEEYLITRTELQQEKFQIENKMKENVELIKVLDESRDPSYESFTPREVNAFNKSKIMDLNNLQETYSTKLDELQQSIFDIDSKILEIDSVIKVASENISEKGISSENLSNVDEENLTYDKEFRLALLATQEFERQRIARDLHDTTVQNLTSLVHKTELCLKLIDADPIRCRLELSTLINVLRGTIEETRNMIYNLRPMTFDDIGFDITVERFLDKLKSNSMVNFSYKVEGTPIQMDSVVELTLLRIIQEACNNSIKHAHPSNVAVKLSYTMEEIILTIQDDGDGFDTNYIPDSPREDNSGFGLSMMRERVYLLSGNFNIESNVGNGCVITVHIPISKEGKADGII